MGETIWAMVFFSFREDHLTFSSLNRSNLLENLPVVYIDYLPTTYHFKDKLRHSL